MGTLSQTSPLSHNKKNCKAKWGTRAVHGEQWKVQQHEKERTKTPALFVVTTQSRAWCGVKKHGHEVNTASLLKEPRPTARCWVNTGDPREGLVFPSGPTMRENVRCLETMERRVLPELPQAV